MEDLKVKIEEDVLPILGKDFTKNTASPDNKDQEE